jgi:hypothetical protein
MSDRVVGAVRLYICLSARLGEVVLVGWLSCGAYERGSVRAGRVESLVRVRVAVEAVFATGGWRVGTLQDKKNLSLCDVRSW